MKLIFILIVFIVLVSGTNKNNDCDYYKRRAIYFEKMATLKDSCISLMDFKTQEAKNKVLKLYFKMTEITIEFAKQ